MLGLLRNTRDRCEAACRAPTCHVGGRAFEPSRPRHSFKRSGGVRLAFPPTISRCWRCRAGRYQLAIFAKFNLETLRERAGEGLSLVRENGKQASHCRHPRRGNPENASSRRQPIRQSAASCRSTVPRYSEFSRAVSPPNCPPHTMLPTPAESSLGIPSTLRRGFSTNRCDCGLAPAGSSQQYRVSHSAPMAVRLQSSGTRSWNGQLQPKGEFIVWQEPSLEKSR